jgi:hypothetical protein
LIDLFSWCPWTKLGDNSQVQTYPVVLIFASSMVLKSKQTNEFEREIDFTK